MSNLFNAEAPRRAVVAMLRTLGGSEVTLRVVSPMGTLDTRGLGLQQYEISEVRLAPAILRQVRSAPDRRWEVLLPASEIEAKLGPDTDAIACALRVGTPMSWNGREFRIAEVACEQFAGREYLYRITLGE
jgi:hypothetical protein